MSLKRSFDEVPQENDDDFLRALELSMREDSTSRLCATDKDDDIDRAIALSLAEDESYISISSTARNHKYVGRDSLGRSGRDPTFYSHPKKEECVSNVSTIYPSNVNTVSDGAVIVNVRDEQECLDYAIALSLQSATAETLPPPPPVGSFQTTPIPPKHPAASVGSSSSSVILELDRDEQEYLDYAIALSLNDATVPSAEVPSTGTDLASPSLKHSAAECLTIYSDDSSDDESVKLDYAIALSLQETDGTGSLTITATSAASVAATSTTSSNPISPEVRSIIHCGLPGCRNEAKRFGFCCEKHRAKASRRNMLAPPNDLIERVFVGPSGDWSAHLLKKSHVEVSN